MADLLPEPPADRSRSPSSCGLTEQELRDHRAGLSEVLGKLEDGVATAEDARKGLQHSANLIRDDSLPDEVGYETLNALVRAAIGKSPGSYKARTTVALDGGDGDSPVLERVPAIRGVYLELDSNARLVSIAIHPSKVRERRKLMGIVGIGSDADPDVARRHDEYLAMQEPHGAG